MAWPTVSTRINELGAGIVVQNYNTLAWNSNGIAVIEWDRGPAYLIFHTSVHNSAIVSQEAPARGIVYVFAWLSAHPTATTHAPSQTNAGRHARRAGRGVPERGGAEVGAIGGSGFAVAMTRRAETAQESPPPPAAQRVFDYPGRSVALQKMPPGAAARYAT